jgi:hypothetical protein
MKKNFAIIFSAVMIISAAARAADQGFESSRAGALDALIDLVSSEEPAIQEETAMPPTNEPEVMPNEHGQLPQDTGHQQPGHPDHPGNNDHHGHHDHNNPPPSHYNFGGYKESCRTFTFNSQSPLSVTESMILEEVGTDCQASHYGAPEHCRPSSKYHSRKVTVNIGARQLESWETERLELCMQSPDYVTADTSGMIYEYAVSSKNDDGFFFKRKTIFTLTPGAKKPAQPDSKELTMTFAGVTAGGDVRLILKDNRADYFKGEKITITADGMNIPVIGQNMPVDQLLASFVKFNVTAAFDVAGSYELKLMDAAKAGKYVVTLKFFRSGPLSSGAAASTIEAFEIK